MTDNWRPERWSEIVRELAFDLYPMDGEDTTEKSIEAGADAMLESLRKEGTHFDKEEWTDDSSFETEVPGTVVFIPDDGG